MGDKSKIEARNEELRRLMETPRPPPREPPRCACGKVARFVISTWAAQADRYYCGDCVPADGL